MSIADAFQATNIEFLKENHAKLLVALEKAEKEKDENLAKLRDWETKEIEFEDKYQILRGKLEGTEEKVKGNRSELTAKNEHIRVLAEQNQGLLVVLEQQETKNKKLKENVIGLQEDNRRLQKIEADFSKVKVEAEDSISAVKSRVLKLTELLRGGRELNQSLRMQLANLEAQAKVDLEALEQTLHVIKQKNLEYMTLIQKREKKRRALESEIKQCNTDSTLLEKEIAEIRAKLNGEQEEQTDYQAKKLALMHAIESREAEVEALKKALAAAERAHETAMEETSRTRDKLREMADKVYGLMDSLRMNQVEVKKLEAENTSRSKKLASLDRMIQNLSSKLQMETEGRELADQEKRRCEEEAQKSRREIKTKEETIRLFQKAADKFEKELADLNSKLQTLQSQNSHLATLVDSQDEEKNKFKAELQKISTRRAALSQRVSEIHDRILQLQAETERASQDKQRLTKELEYIKREDLLDEAGRQRPILIQSNESVLLEQMQVCFTLYCKGKSQGFLLQINEFLYESQQQRNPIPMLVEKMAQMLEMLHHGQTTADRYLGDLSKSNSLVAALRAKNLTLCSKVAEGEAFKARAVTKYLANRLEAGSLKELRLEGLQITGKEVDQILSLIRSFQAQHHVLAVHLDDNILDDKSVSQVSSFIFEMPYLRMLSLSGNCYTSYAVSTFDNQIRGLDGVTHVNRSAENELEVHSGAQLRLVVDLSEQVTPPPDAPMEERKRGSSDLTAQNKMVAQESDELLAGPGGLIHPPPNQLGRKPPKQQQSQLSLDPQAQVLRAVGAVGSSIIQGGDGPGSQAPINKMPPAISTQNTTQMQQGGVPVGLGGPGDLTALDGRRPGARGQNTGQAKKAKKPAKAGQRAPSDAGDSTSSKGQTRARK